MEQPKDRGYAYSEEEGYQQGARPKQDVLRQRYSGGQGARSPRQQTGSTAAAMVQVHASTTSTSSTTTNQDPNRITPVAEVDTVSGGRYPLKP